MHIVLLGFEFFFVSQIQKLLDAQSKVSEPLQVSAEERQQEQAIQTAAVSEPQKQTGVSIAVGTGAATLSSATVLHH